MPIPLRRDEQQWLFDWAIKETGQLRSFQGDNRSFPRTVRMQAQIGKTIARAALRLARVAKDERAAGHNETALEVYFDAANLFAQAQHAILETNDEKRFFHEASIRCFDRVRELAPYPIEHLHIPWDDDFVAANLHLAPGDEPKPCVIFVPGCDMTKEMYPHPWVNHAHQRGMHILSIDGPGQGELNLAGVRLTVDNYERAVRAVVDYLEGRPEVSSVALFGLSFGSYWAARAAATDDRFVAFAAPWCSWCDKRYLMDYSSPAYKQLFAYLMQPESEAQLDGWLADMRLDDMVGTIACPTVMTVGEYDPRSPLDELLALYGAMQCERELWVFEDQHHVNTIAGRGPTGDVTVWNMDIYLPMLDWIRDRVQLKPVARSGQVLYVEPTGGSPNGANVRTASWFETIRNTTPGD